MTGKITDLTASAGVAPEDLIEVVDDPSGTPASRKATLGDVAALGGSLFFPAFEWHPFIGSANVQTSGGGDWASRLFATGVSTGVNRVFLPPSWLATFDAYIWWTAVETSSGNVVWRWYSLANAGTQRSAGDALGTANTLIETTHATTGVTQQVVRSLVASGQTLLDPNGDIVRLQLLRFGPGAEDTYENSVRFLGVELVPNP